MGKVLIKLSGDFIKEARKIKNDIFCINHADFKIEEWAIRGNLL